MSTMSIVQAACVSDWLTADFDNVFMCMISWMIHPPCEITDQLLAVGTQNCFSTLFYTPYHSSFLACNSRLRSLILTLKQPPKMHHCQTKNQKIPHWGRGIPPPQTSPPSAPSAPRLSRLRRSAFPFLFIYDSNTGYVTV